MLTKWCFSSCRQDGLVIGILRLSGNFSVALKVNWK
jgi:hypothetical protein